MSASLAPTLPSVAEEEAHDQPTAIAVSSIRVLVIDDDPAMRRAVTKSLERIGFQVITAEDGRPALAMVELTPPDLVVVDLNMPTSGIEVVRILKKRHGASLWVAVHSAQDDEETRQACYAAGADDVIVKSVLAAEFRRRLLAAARTQQAYVEARLAREQIERRLSYGAEAAALLAHDLNNGLAVALSNLSFVVDAELLQGDNAEALDATCRALRKMSGLVSNFVDIARFEDAAVTPHCTRVRVCDFLANVVETHGHTPRAHLRIVVECEQSLVGWFDASLVERVLHNLVGNATRYCPPGGAIRVAAAQLVDASSGQTGVTIEVSNDGPAIPPALVGQLFAKYAKGSTGKRGFGLYFCRLACEAHRGSIMHRQRDGGPAFVVELPGRSSR